MSQSRAPILSILIALMLGCFACGAAVLRLSPAVAAQARPVDVQVRTFPEVPSAGELVTVLVDVQGCRTDVANVEVMLTSSDGARQSSSVVERGTARLTVLWAMTAAIQLPDAIPGWYGIRIVCGASRPEHKPMPNTYFAIGSVERSSDLSTTAATAGDTIEMTGTGCNNGLAQYDLTNDGANIGPFDAEQTVPAGPDGAWVIPITFPRDQQTGPITFRARCVIRPNTARPIYLFYGTQLTIDVTALPEEVLEADRVSNSGS
ncbi:MAG TPA: hypothetical protein DEG43_00535 [Acidimicrobiaceae bacterium]|jgi:hypothetical protein|nr:hypothetical protein [Acidimicrobiaceae bacterium]